MLFVGTSIIHPSTEGVFLLCNILDLLIYSKIPENERSSVYNYETSSQWLLSGLEPYDKYCITADHFSMLSNEIFQHIQNLFEHREPMYIVTGRNVQIQNQIVQTYLEKDYTELYTNNIYTLYQKIP